MQEKPTKDSHADTAYTSDQPPVPSLEVRGQASQKDPITQGNTGNGENKKRIGIPSWIQAVASIILVIVTGIYAYYAGQQWKTLRDTMTVTEKLVDSATKQTESSILAADAATQANVLAERSIQQTLESTRLDQRAWVSTSRFILDKEPIGGDGIKISCFLTNSGKTPAIAMTTKSGVYVRAEDPPRPQWANIKPVNAVVLPPGTTTYRFDARLDAITPAAADAYRNSRSKIYIRALISYEDIFGKRHCTEICAFHAFGTKPDEFTFCEHDNNVDQQHCST